jgi:hypothetical protein
MIAARTKAALAAAKFLYEALDQATTGPGQAHGAEPGRGVHFLRGVTG